MFVSKADSFASQAVVGTDVAFSDSGYTTTDVMKSFLDNISGGPREVTDYSLVIMDGYVESQLSSCAVTRTPST